MLYKIKYFCIASILSFLFVVSIYNLDVFIYQINKLYERQTLIYIAITFFYLWLYGIIKSKSGLPTKIVIAICVICPIAIDATVLITAPNKVPHRFPFASVFPFIGILLGYYSFLNKKMVFWILLFLLIPIFFLIDQYILPKMFYYEYVRDSPGINSNIINNIYYTVNGEPVKIIDTSKNQYTIVECFFKGCLPCEEKKAALKIISDSIKEKKLSIVFLCDGSITEFDDFREYALKDQSTKNIYLYDKDSVLYSKYKINGYPFEVLFKEDKAINTLLGYSEMIKKDYIKNTLLKLK